MMFSRRRQEAAREHAANKQKAHAENHKRVLEAEKPKAKEEKKKDGAVKPGAK